MSFSSRSVSMILPPKGWTADTKSARVASSPTRISADVSFASDEIAFDDPKLDEFAASLANDTSALILVGEEATLADFVSAVQPFGGKIIETDLDEKDITALQKALRKAA